MVRAFGPDVDAAIFSAAVRVLAGVASTLFPAEGCVGSRVLLLAAGRYVLVTEYVQPPGRLTSRTSDGAHGAVHADGWGRRRAAVRVLSYRTHRHGALSTVELVVATSTETRRRRDEGQRTMRDLALHTRRAFLGMAGAVGLGALSGAAGYVIDRAMRSDPAGAGSLADVDHFVLLMQENRSFDHYFGTLSGVRGYDDMSRRLAQSGYRPGVGPDPTGRVAPFHLSTRAHPNDFPQIPVDPSHSWVTQHSSWNNGAMDAWITTHLAADGAQIAPEIMGYYTRAELPTHYLLADAFTVCDHYFSSVLGPTAPNRLYWLSGTLDPDGEAGGPLLSDAAAISGAPLRWPTYPEKLSEAGVSWKIYNALPADQRSELTGMVKYFANFQQPHLAQRGLAPRFPADFRADVANGTLPAVSWLIPSEAQSEHPAFPSARGAEAIVEVLDILTDNPAVWERSALIVSYDENGGFFDHVAPPTAPPGTAGEYLTAASPNAEPIGLGFRVPCLVISPYTTGGNVYSSPLDHTSQLRMLERRYGVEVPNLSEWRRNVVTDFADVFDRVRSAPASTVEPTVARSWRGAARQVEELRGARGHTLRPYPVPANDWPRQEREPVRHRID